MEAVWPGHLKDSQAGENESAALEVEHCTTEGTGDDAQWEGRAGKQGARRADCM